MEKWHCPECSYPGAEIETLIKYGTRCLDAECEGRTHLNVNGFMYTHNRQESQESEGLGISEIAKGYE